MTFSSPGPEGFGSPGEPRRGCSRTRTGGFGHRRSSYRRRRWGCTRGCSRWGWRVRGRREDGVLDRDRGVTEVGGEQLVAKSARKAVVGDQCRAPPVVVMVFGRFVARGGEAEVVGETAVLVVHELGWVPSHRTSLAGLTRSCRAATPTRTWAGRFGPRPRCVPSRGRGHRHRSRSRPRRPFRSSSRRDRRTNPSCTAAGSRRWCCPGLPGRGSRRNSWCSCDRGPERYHPSADGRTL